MPRAAREGERIIEYKGERISWKEALRRHPHNPDEPNHTFYFALENGKVIDGKVDGNSARYINHSCAPNCEAEEKEGRVFIHALREIEEDEELFYDYGLVIDGRITKKLKKEYECRCGAQEVPRHDAGTEEEKVGICRRCQLEKTPRPKLPWRFFMPFSTASAR